MASDFYQRTLALYEEFRQSELQYLRTERSLTQDKDLHNGARNIPLEQYLHKIKVREQETERTYSDTMKMFENLDKQVDMMALKVEKLQVLQKSLNAASIHDIPTQPSSSSIGSNLNFYLPRENLNSISEEHNVILAYQYETDKLYSSSTQTNSVLCSQCKNQILPKTFSDSENRIVHLDLTDKESELLSVNEKSHQLTNINKDTSILKTETVPENETLEQIKISSVVQESKSKSVASNDHDKSSNLNEAHKNDLGITELLLNQASNDLCKELHEEVIFQSSDQSNTPADVSRSKSDDESMNHEFDFLESDHKGPSLSNAAKNQKTDKVLEQKDSPELSSETIHKVVHEASSEIPLPMPRRRSSAYTREKDSVMKTAPTKNSTNNKALETTSSKNVDVRKTKNKGLDVENLTASVTLHKSLSNTDTEESSSEKNVPLTSTAAYQALLGKAPISRRVQQVVDDPTESETEDEMENALYTAINKRQSIIPEKQEMQKIEESKIAAAPANLPAETKEFSRRPSTAVVGKPQTKLSKKTRKVLGLDTSSGSEVEPEVIPQKVVTEDSDEFDFYD